MIIDGGVPGSHRGLYDSANGSVSLSVRRCSPTPPASYRRSINCSVADERAALLIRLDQKTIVQFAVHAHRDVLAGLE